MTRRITYKEIASMNPAIRKYIQRLRPSRRSPVNPWRRYELAKKVLIPLIPDHPGAYEAVIKEIARRLRL